jgi:phosphonate transport system ATP-binding protein
MASHDPLPTDADPVLRVRHAHKSFGARRALDNVSFEVAAGEMIALIGPSGSGKSTLLRAVTGLAALDVGDGEIVVFGRRTQARGKVTDEARRVRAGVGFISQQFNLVGRLSLYTNVALGSLGRIGFWRGLLGLWPNETKTLVMQALGRVGVADAAGQRANTLSGGQQQRGAIARALVQRARIVLADEPVASLDPVSARRVMEILRDLNRDDGLTVLVTLHQVDYALRYCDRVVALRAGKIAYDGPTPGLTRDRLIDIYGPQFEDAYWQGAMA